MFQKKMKIDYLGSRILDMFTNLVFKMKSYRWF